MKKIGFLSFGHWSASPSSQVRSASDALIQSLELAVAAEEVGADGAYFRVHHFARQLGSPFPLLAAIGARTSRIEIGTAVIDMRYENPLYMVEDAGAADLLAGGRLQLGISRGSPEQVIDGWRYFGYQPAEGETDADMARRHTEVFLEVLEGGGVRPTEPAADVRQPAGPAHGRAALAGVARPDLVGRRIGHDRSLGGNPRHEPDELDPGRRRRERRPVPRRAGPAHRAPSARRGRKPGTSASRASPSAAASSRSSTTSTAGTSVTSDDGDHVGYIDATTRAIFGRTYAAEPDVLVDQLAEDEAIAAADTLLLTVPNQLGVDYNAHAIESILKYVAPELGWR